MALGFRAIAVRHSLKGTVVHRVRMESRMRTSSGQNLQELSASDLLPTGEALLPRLELLEPAGRRWGGQPM